MLDMDYLVCRRFFPTFVIISTCMVTNIFAVEPSFDVPVVNITVIAGKTAILPCSVDFLGDHKVVWTDQFSTLLTFDIQRIIDDDRIGIDRPYTQDWNLIIHDVRYSDRGKYICQINTQPVKTKSVELIVQVPPMILDDSSSDDIVCREGDTVTLTCNVTGVPTPTVHWYRRPLNEGSAMKEKIGSDGEMLIIHNVSRYCDGIYECVAFNEISPAVNREIVVKVEFAPEIQLPNKRISQEVGKETILECIIVAYPQAVSLWRFKGEEVKMSSAKHRIELYDDGNHQITLSLRIIDITKEDFGKYTCHASNRLGSDKESMEFFDLKRNRKPKPTKSIVVTQPQTTRRYDIFSPDPSNGFRHSGQLSAGTSMGDSFNGIAGQSSFSLLLYIFHFVFCLL